MITIYFDMDGVLADFEKKYYQHFDTHIDSTPDHILWNNIKKIEDFWLNLDEIEGSRNIWDFAHLQPKTEIEILSAPSRHDERSLPQKNAWLDQKYPKHTFKRNFVRARDKQKFANSKSILIDDMKRNTDQFISAGGKSILFNNSNQVLEDLKKVLDELIS